VVSSGGKTQPKWHETVNELIDAAAEIQGFCIERGWKFCFIGGLVVQHWAEARFTKDIDLTLLTGFGSEEVFIDEWLRHFRSRRSDAREFALAHRVLLLRSSSGLPVDVALGAFPFEGQAVDRASDVEVFPGKKLRFCSPEDLIVMKAFASRDLDWQDVRMTIARQGADSLDWKYIREQLEPLAILKGEPEIVTQLEGLRKKVARKTK
jgi:hypothetical protein